MIEVSHSKASMARGCWKKYYWCYEEGLRPVSRSVALTLGGIVHEGFDKFYKGEYDISVLKWLAQSFDDEISKVSLPDQEGLLIAKYTALGMWSFNPEKHEKFDELKSEVEFNIRLKGLRSVRLKGRFDGQVKKNGVWWVREVKTTGLNQRQFEGRAQTSAQASMYVHAARQLGYPVEGLMFDYLKKPLLRKRTDETAHDFGKRIYEDYKAKPKFYFGRVYTYRNPDQMSLFEEDTVDMVREIRSRHRTYRYPRNPDQCWNFNSECPYKKICFQKVPDPLTVQLYYTKQGGTNGNTTRSTTRGPNDSGTINP
jgi:hypothetical protein